MAEKMRAAAIGGRRKAIDLRPPIRQSGV